MNKQEAIEKIKNIDTLNINDRVAGQQVDMVMKNPVLGIISLIDEPKKVVVPQTIFDVIENFDEEFDYLHEHISHQSEGVKEWLTHNERDFYEAWLAYPNIAVEQEKLYTVEIADAILTKITRGRNVQYKMLPSKDVSDVFDKGIYATGLTETEIKQKDERLWQFAKEVE